MAMIDCSECNARISDAAQACPKCGNPMRELVTTQQTSKRFKAAQAFGALLLLAGVVSCSAGAESSPYLIMGGMSVLIFSKAAAWWHNG